ncbi:hypothetical protein P5P86_17300 [Nocardioides sp. BP30]|uniref:hypothetical protein n=1 Tax=Nocardioides sp. BP30 TaxID=3036374 RepID=UPI002468691C|nr:hypothetical protein [Nocardioides sp. BP30]WGL51702.1 hypothetical protein P5P86_17300 [Nocardioides sp. BP30]
MSEESAEQVRWFRANGRLTGVLMLVLWVAIAVFGVIDGAPPVLFGALAVLAVLTHVTLLRPAIGATHDDLIYRQMFSDLRIPLAAVDAMRIVRFFEVTVAGRRYVSPALSRRRRRRPLRRLPGMAEERPEAEAIYVDMVEDTLRVAVADAKAHGGRSGAQPPPIRRTWVWPEIAAMAAAVVLLVVLAAI